jgi:hypothetical protein
MSLQSESIAKLTEALSKAQNQIEGAREDSKNPFFKSQYADLSSIWRACKKPLTENGLAVIQTMESKNEEIILITTLAHSSGEWIKSSLPVIVTKRDPQSIGSAITYARRYALAAIAGVCPYNEDDDAEKAMEIVREEKPQKNSLDILLKDYPNEVEKLKKIKKVNSIHDLKTEEVTGFVNYLKAKKSELQEV